MAEPRILVLARAPVPGAVKTRLVPALGAAGAAALHARLLERTLATARAVPGAAVELWCTPDLEHPAFAAAAAHGATLRLQPAGDLGARMHHALASALAAGGTPLLVGCDCPALTVEDFLQAAAALADHDVVLAPAEDGGYALIGARRVTPLLFEGVEWGGARVLRQTRARLVALGWRWHELRTLWDVDRPDDLARLAEVGLG